MIHVSIIQNIEAFENLSTTWNELLLKSASHVPFLRHEYLFNWWQTLGGGEWQNGKLSIILAQDDHQQVFGIAPLFLTRNHQNENVLMFLGSIEISDFLDFIVPLEKMEIFYRTLLEHLLQNTSLEWQALDLYNILDDSPTIHAITNEAQRLGLKVQQETVQHSPYIPLTNNWETYLATLEKKQRHEIRRKIRRLEESGTSYRWYIADDENRLPGEVENLFALMAFDPEKKAFLTAPMRHQMQLTIQAAFQNQWLQLAFLEIEGEKAAAYLNFDYDNQIWVYNSGINNRFNAYSPGWVLLSYLIQWAIEHQRQTFDFMRGNEDYKYRFGAIDRFVNRIKIIR
ncbi:MAG: GNAT family N-acetyltransferase [Anaerolineales bacterium]